MATDEHIEPCPFCASDNVGYVDGIDDIVWCRNCGAERRANGKRKVIKRWNTRPIEDSLRARIEQLEKVVKRAKLVLNRRGEPSISEALRILAEDE